MLSRIANRQEGKDALINDGSSAQDAASVAAAARRTSPQSTDRITLEKFATLPHELQKQIIELACSNGPPLPSSLAAAGVGAAATSYTSCPGLDVTTTLNLALAARSLYALVIPSLYSMVSLSLPSTLAAFHHALTAKPALGRLVKSLHVGLWSPAPEWCALEYRQGYVRSGGPDESEMYEPDRRFMRTSLQSERERKLLPLWCSADDRWSVDEPGSGAAARAVWDALYEAQWVINIKLWQPSSRMQSADRELFYVVDRTQCIAESQAVLDLYLMELRRWEDEKGISRSGGAGKEESGSNTDEKEDRESKIEEPKYPTLVLTGYPRSSRRHVSSKSSADKERFVLDRSQVLQHLARPGSAYDSFYHPLLFARSGEQIIWLSSEHDYEGRATHKFLREPEEDWDEFFSDPYKASLSLDWTLPNTATIGSLLSLLSSVLSHTLNLENLSLTGFLERAACGTRGMGAVLRKLRTISLGPPPFRWYAPLRLEFLPASLEELRLCGIRLHEEELEAIVKMFPRLQRLCWTVVYQYSKEHTPSLKEAIARLVGLRGAFEDDLERPSGAFKARGSSSSDQFPVKSSRELDFARSRSRSPGNSPDLDSIPLIEISLYHSDLHQLLDTAPSPAARAAWLSGAPLPELQERRLLLRKSRFSLQALYEEGREWWEERAGIGRGGS